MDANILIPLAAGLVGTLIGSLSSLLVIRLQLKEQGKRERMKLASEMARDEHKLNYEIAKHIGKRAALAPVVTYQHHHYQILLALESGDLTTEKHLEINRENKALIQALENEERNS